MHRNHFAKLFVLSLLVVAGAGCTKHAEGIPGATGPAGQAGANGASVKSSPITGYIDLLDPYGAPFSYSPGVTLSTLKGDSTVIATTDSTGKFSLPALPPGNYDIHVTKSGFDSLKIFVQHAGGDEAKFIGGKKMYQTISAKITSQTPSFHQDIFGNSNLYLTTTLSVSSPVAVERACYYFFSHSSIITGQNSDYTIGSGLATNGNQFTFQFLLTNLTQYARRPFHTGDSVYVKTILSHPFEIMSYYYDYAADRYIQYPYLGDSATTWFRMP